MEGISKERLIEEMNLAEHLGYNESYRTIQGLICQCTELNPWLPVAAAPKDKELHLVNNVIGQWIGYVNDPIGNLYATHYHELQDDPK